MNTKQNLLVLAVLTTSLALVGCGGSGSSGNQQVEEDTTPDGPTFPTAFAFSQDPVTALDEMKELPERAFPPELHQFLRSQFIDGATAGSKNRFNFWFSYNEDDNPSEFFKPIQCGATDFGTLKPQPGFTQDNANSFTVTVADDAAAIPLGDNKSLFRQNLQISFRNCEIVEPDDNDTVIATINGVANIERTWVGESNSPDVSVVAENFSLDFQFFNVSDPALDIELTSSGDTYRVLGKFIETAVFGEVTAAQKNTLSDPSLSVGTSDLVLSRLASHDFKGMYAFDAEDLQITTTLSGESPATVQFNNFASVFVADLFGAGATDEYKVSVEAHYRGDETAGASSIVFGTGDEAETIFIETLSAAGNNDFIAADITSAVNPVGLLRTGQGTAFLDCPAISSIGYSSTPEAPLIAGLSFTIDNTNATVRVFVDETNTQTDREPAAAFSTSSLDRDCRPDNGPTKYIPLPGLGDVDYTLPI
jgi:hypothetical protein